MGKLPREGSKLEETMLGQLRLRGLPVPEREYVFASPRRFRFDFCWPERMMALEVDGGTYAGGRHTRPEGFERDVEKLNLATEMGWRVYRATTKTVKDGSAAEMMQRILGKEEDGVDDGGAGSRSGFAAARAFVSRIGIPGGEAL